MLMLDQDRVAGERCNAVIDAKQKLGRTAGDREAEPFDEFGGQHLLSHDLVICDDYFLSQDKSYDPEEEWDRRDRKRVAELIELMLQVNQFYGGDGADGAKNLPGEAEPALIPCLPDVDILVHECMWGPSLAVSQDDMSLPVCCWQSVKQRARVGSEGAQVLCWRMTMALGRINGDSGHLTWGTVLQWQ